MQFMKGVKKKILKKNKNFWREKKNINLFLSLMNLLKIGSYNDIIFIIMKKK